MNDIKKQWTDALGKPAEDMSAGDLTLVQVYSYADFDIELYVGRRQRVMMVIPKGVPFPAPAAAIPFYFPEGMLGFDPATGEDLSFFKGIEMMVHLAKRGYITVCGDAFHLTYIDSDADRMDFSRWRDGARALKQNNPDYTGMGKLVDDTVFLVDVLCGDARVDSNRIAAAGHSLGGKMAFYAGCLDDRVQAILASDFGFGWDMSNWNDEWYWGEKVRKLISRGMDHTQLLGIASPKPFCLLAGQYDNEKSDAMMRSACGYANGTERLLCINHATGHRPPLAVLEKGYDFLDRWVKDR